MKSIFNLTLVAGLALVSAATASAQTATGNVRAVRVQGDVQVSKVQGGPSIKLVEGAVLKEKTSIVTGAEGRVILLLSSGTAVSVRPSSDILLETFLQEPFAAGTDLRKLTEEPTVSKTRFVIRDGSLVASVKKLKAGSEFSVRNPLGAAGVRGTKLETSFDKKTTKSTTTTISGQVVWKGDFQGTSDVPLVEGDKVLVDGKLDGTGKVIEYREQVVKETKERIDRLNQEAKLLDDTFGNANPETEVPESVAADPDVQQQPPVPSPDILDRPQNPSTIVSPTGE